jgi:hypothetical protein
MFRLIFCLQSSCGCTVAQVVSSWLPIVARVRSRDESYGCLGGQSVSGAGFLRVLRFPMTNIPPVSPHSSISIIRGWYNRPWPTYQADSVSPHPKKRFSYHSCITVESPIFLILTLEALGLNIGLDFGYPEDFLEFINSRN